MANRGVRTTYAAQDASEKLAAELGGLLLGEHSTHHQAPS